MTATSGRETLYRGVKMRSRLEADYAANLDRQQYRWAYEPTCFAGPGGQWLPDFGCTFADDKDWVIFDEVKPAEPLMKHLPASIAYVQHVDAILQRMAVAWESKPDAYLRLTFWKYGDGPYLTLNSRRAGDVWYAEFGEQPMWLLWSGMGQFLRCKGAPS
jgi:hypothetical protein